MGLGGGDTVVVLRAQGEGVRNVKRTEPSPIGLVRKKERGLRHQARRTQISGFTVPRPEELITNATHFPPATEVQRAH